MPERPLRRGPVEQEKEKQVVDSRRCETVQPVQHAAEGDAFISTFNQVGTRWIDLTGVRRWVRLQPGAERSPSRQ